MGPASGTVWSASWSLRLSDISAKDSPADFEFVLRLKSLISLNLLRPFPIDCGFIQKVLEGLGFVSYFRIFDTEDNDVIEVSMDH